MAKRVTHKDRMVAYFSKPATCEDAERDLNMLHQTAAAMLGKLVADGSLKVVGMKRNSRNREVNMYQATTYAVTNRRRVDDLVRKLELLVAEFKEV